MEAKVINDLISFLVIEVQDFTKISTFISIFIDEPYQ